MSWEQFRVNGCGMSNFTTWFDRHHGRGWCWREKQQSRAVKSGAQDLKEGCGFASRRAAKRGIENELGKRRARLNATALLNAETLSATHDSTA